MARGKSKGNSKTKLMIIDMILSIGSAILSYYIIGIVGDEVYLQTINASIVYLPICAVLSMLLVRGYRTNLKHTSVYDFVRYTVGLVIATLLYVSVDLVMGYTQIIVFKLFASVLAFVLMMGVRLAYYAWFRVNGGVKRIEEKEVVTHMNSLDIDFDELIEDESHKKIRLDVDATRYFQDKTVLITGAGGTIGSSIYRRLVKLGAKRVVGLDIYENTLYELEQSLEHEETSTEMIYEIASIRDYKKMDEIMAMYRPDVIYHAAAHKHVSVMEKNPEEAVKNNVFGTFTCAKLADVYNVEKFIFISTDKAHNPCSIMGATKRIGEIIMNYMAAKSRATNYVTLRFCNIIGSNASVVPLICQQIECGGPVYVTDRRASRYFISSKEAVNYIINMTIKILASDIYILDMNKSVYIKDLAHKLIKAYGLKPNTDIDVKFTTLRDGERLTEELVPKQARAISEGIYKIEHEKMNGRAFYRKLNLLNIATKENDKDNIRKIISDILPEFEYKVSKTGTHKNKYYTIANTDEFVG